MHILFPSDVFPPDGRGGAAWSSHALALALGATGHTLTAIVPARGRTGVRPYDALGVPAVQVGYRALRLPFVQNYLRHERFWPRLADVIVAAGRRGPPPDLIHAQHVQTAPAAVIAGRRLGVPVVVSVRDHWPWHYFATGLHGDRLPLNSSGWATLATELPARLGPLRGSLALAALPYMVAHMRRRAAFLAQADAVIACSAYVAARLAGIVPPQRIHILPHMVDIPAVTRAAAPAPTAHWEGALLLFAGKLEANKGAGLLPEIFRSLYAQHRSLPPFTLVIAGDGALRRPLEAELASIGVPTQWLAWADHDESLRLFARCDVLLFPSAWGEPLSRVLLEAAALGAPMLAMPTGGTPDIITDSQTGALASTPAAFATRLAELLGDPQARRRLGNSARAAAAARFSVPQMLPRYLALYQGLRTGTS